MNPECKVITKSTTTTIERRPGTRMIQTCIHLRPAENNKSTKIAQDLFLGTMALFEYCILVFEFCDLRRSPFQLHRFTGLGCITATMKIVDHRGLR